MPMPARSWRRPAMCFVTSSPRRYWGSLSSDWVSSERTIMSRTIWLGAVAYDPKVVTIWEGMRRYFLEEAKLDVEIVLFQSYEAQVQALLAAQSDPVPHIDIGWKTNLAFLQASEWSDQSCRPIAMRDTDRGWMTKIVAVNGGPIAKFADIKGHTLALGSRDSGHAAIMPVHFLAREGLAENKDYRTLRF